MENIYPKPSFSNDRLRATPTITSSGIKFLLNIRNLKTEDIDNDDFVKESKRLIQMESYDDEYNKMTDEYYKKNIDEMDVLIKDILNTKQDLKMNKLKESIKTKEDFLNFYQIKDESGRYYAPEPVVKDSKYLKKLGNIKNPDTIKRNRDFKNIKSIINQQNDLIKDLEIEKPEDNIIYKESFFPTYIDPANPADRSYINNIKNNSNNNNLNNSSMCNSISTMNNTLSSQSTFVTSKNNFTIKNPLMNKNNYNLTNEERDFMNKHIYNSYDSDDLMEELDNAIKIGEEIDDYINYIEKKD